MTEKPACGRGGCNVVVKRVSSPPAKERDELGTCGTGDDLDLAETIGTDGEVNVGRSIEWM